MPARTRTSNQDSDFKVYYSKKIPKQRHFPERRKTVRREPSSRRHEREYQQTKLLSENGRTDRTVLDSEDEEELAGEEGQQNSSRQAQQLHPEPKERCTGASLKGTKRRHNAIKEEVSEEDEELIRPSPKRRRRNANIKQEEPPAAHEAASSDEGGGHDSSDVDEGESERTRRRRQSTMTQIVNGRRPGPDAREPEFKPIKRTSRKSWSGRNLKRDVQQRTLTQMVPGLIPLGLMSEEIEDEDEDEEQLESEPESDDQAYNDAIATHLTRHGVFSPDRNGSDEKYMNLNSADWEAEDDERYSLTQNRQERPARLVHISKGTRSEESIKMIGALPSPAKGISKRARFGLLSTPEKRRIREIASSQSPVESVLSTQTSPEKLHRSPLQERAANRLQDTPSKRKRVTFQKPAQTSTSPRLRRDFGIVVQDSDDEDLSWGEEDEELDERVDMDSSAHPFVQGPNVGEETQALLDQIDRACAHGEGNVVASTRGVSEELGDPLVCRRSNDEDESGSGNGVESAPVQTEFKCQPRHRSVETAREDDLPSSPIVIKDEFSDDEDDHNPTPLHPLSPSLHATPNQTSQARAGSTDLDGERIRGPDSSSQGGLETQQSHCSKAEQQLQSEFRLHTQSQRPHQSSSMHVAHDPFSYQDTPFTVPTLGQEKPSRVTIGISQATTVDGTQPSPKHTPRKAATQPPTSATTTPRKEASASTFLSPQQPPPLLIPSSFPTPGKTGCQNWSSPTFRRYTNGNGGSIEDFSIPPLPPTDDDTEDD